MSFDKVLFCFRSHKPCYRLANSELTPTVARCERADVLFTGASASVSLIFRRSERQRHRNA